MSKITIFSISKNENIEIMQQTTIPIEITHTAMHEIKSIMQNKAIPPTYGLRVGIKGTGGCGGAATFLLGFDKQKPEDQAYILDNIPIYIEKKHLMFVLGMQINFEETEEGLGFTFSNPNANK